MIYKLIYYFFKEKLRKYNGFNYGLYKKWFQECPLPFLTKIKILHNTTIINNFEIREYIRKYYLNNKDKLDKYDYIISLGEPGKSGDIVLYELRHGLEINGSKFIRMDEILKKRADANILFIDDLIGTGKQSVKYINEKVNTILLSSRTKFSIMALFATVDGAQKVSAETNVDNIYIINTITDDWNIFDSSSNIFSKHEKQDIQTINDLLAGAHDNFNRGFLLAFSYGVPNNSIRLLWKHEFSYSFCGKEKKWCAIFPRKY